MATYNEKEASTPQPGSYVTKHTFTKLMQALCYSCIFLIKVKKIMRHERKNSVG